MVEDDLRASQLAEGDREGLTSPAPDAAGSPRSPAARRRLAVIAAALAAAALSALHVALVLRGGPRIVDATTYLLEARAMAHGLLAWEPAEPGSSVAGRFLVHDALGGGSRVAGIFPPGWPAVLALFVLAGAPMASGPVLAFLVTLATAWLGHELVRIVRATRPPDGGGASLDARGLDDRALDLVPAGAAAVSAVCACLRYHTADTMSHGLAAVLLTVALAGALRARHDRRLVLRVAVGLALGWLIATRPFSGLAALIVVLVVTPRRLRDLAPIGLGLVPGIALLLVHQRAATGAWLASSQSLYYALSDGPIGCFRYGFGAGIGCEHEHGAFVAANLPDGYGAYAATATTLRRLKAHLVDPLNAEPLLALVVLGGIALRRAPAARVVVAAPVALLLAHVPFYFDGNYPGGGARFLADALPVEHVLAVLGALALAARSPRLRPRPGAVAAGLVALSVIGFAARARADHRLLRDREGGRPMFEAAEIRATKIERGLVFVDTDHGFALGHDPAVRAADGVEVLRRRGDALDRLAWEERGRPPTFLYGLSTLADGALAEVTVTPWEPPPSSRIEGESLWPVLGARGASAWPRWVHGPCASAGRRLGVGLAADEGAVEVALPDRLPERARLAVHLHRTGGIEVVATVLGDGAPADTVVAPGHAVAPACEVLHLAVPPRAEPTGAPARSLRLRLAGRRVPGPTSTPTTGDPAALPIPHLDRARVDLALDAIDVLVAD